MSAMKSSKPLVSCLMITRAASGRFALLKNSIRCFCAQTYPSLELVILLDSPKASDKMRLNRFLKSLDQENIRVIERKKKSSLGTLRNESVLHASGEFICQWDDDDLSHPERVERQVSFLRRSRASAVLLGQFLHYFMKEQRIYWGYWFESGLPCTLLMRKDAAYKYARVSKHEDSMLISDLHRSGELVTLIAEPHLYLYVFHGKNVFNRRHHLRMARKSSADALRLISCRRELQAGLKRVGIETSKLKFCDREGIVFGPNAKRMASVKAAAVS